MLILLIITCLMSSSETIKIPPVEFDHLYEGNLTTVMVSTDKIHAYCDGYLMAKDRIMACSIVYSSKNCTIVLPVVDDTVSQYQQDRLRRHEIGHCNGWLADHAGGIQ